MALDAYLTFIVATMVLHVVPGPTVMLVVSYALSHGPRSGLSTTLGVSLGNVVAISACYLGLGALLLASATLFAALKWIGVGYLVYLGLRLWLDPVAAAATPATDPRRTGRRVLAHAFAVTALNPKGMVFYLAYFPQFVRSDAPLLPQWLLLGGTFIALGALNVLTYALLAGAASRAVQRPAFRRATNRMAGTLLVGAGLLTAGVRRAG